MKIAVHAADLDHQRIDGTRVYLLNILKNFGKIDRENSFFIYHKSNFNPKLKPPKFPNYFFERCQSRAFWTQTAFAFRIFRDSSDVLWMPVQNLPILRRRNLKTVVTIHDLAFKIFPEHFTAKDLFKLNMLTDKAVRSADHIIAISNSTKKDILKFYPDVKEGKISVVHNGFDRELFEKKISSEVASIDILKKYGLESGNYLLYVGAIQPRKNINVLIDAFEIIKKGNSKIKLAIAGAPAWKYEEVFEKISQSSFKEDIVITDTMPFEHLPAFYQNALIFIFPSLYEGFGIPILEAMASGVPVISAKNSSIPEVAGNAALFFDAENPVALAENIEKIIAYDDKRKELIEKGFKQAQKFSWRKCAEETLKVLLDARKNR